MKIDKEFVKIFFKKVDVTQDLDIEREKFNKDIRIVDKVNKKKYIIENKLKSFVSKEQLNRYKKEEDEKDEYKKEYLLVCLIKPKMVPSGWDKIKYIEIAKRIKMTLKKEIRKYKELKKYKNIINEYCNYVINEIGNIEKDQNVRKKQYSNRINEDHNKTGLNVIRKKLKARKMQEVIDDYIEKLVKKFKNKHYVLESKLGYSNTTHLTYSIKSKNFENEKKFLSCF